MPTKSNEEEQRDTALRESEKNRTNSASNTTIAHARTEFTTRTGKTDKVTGITQKRHLQKSNRLHQLEATVLKTESQGCCCRGPLVLVRELNRSGDESRGHDAGVVPGFARFQPITPAPINVKLRPTPVTRNNNENVVEPPPVRDSINHNSS
jgi:hypothetical protein